MKPVNKTHQTFPAQSDETRIFIEANIETFQFDFWLQNRRLQQFWLHFPGYAWPDALKAGWQRSTDDM